MPKYLVTSGSHFTPFTYDELVKPVAHMQQVHDATQDAYDQLNLETNALRQYISDNPGDSRAKAMYDNYMDKLTTLQNNLWEHGVNAQTRRDLSAARSAYASDITRLGKAIQTRQERSKEYWDMRHKNPDLIMGEDPGLGGLNDYLANENYGQDYFSYSGAQFEKEVADDAKARANEMLRDPQVLKNPELAGYLTTITHEGFTGQEVDNAKYAVRLALAGDTSALSNLDTGSSILANVLMSHLESTGASGRVSAEEFNRLVNYGMSGLSHAVGKTDVRQMTDKVWDFNKSAALQNLRASSGRGGTGNGTETPRGPGYDLSNVTFRIESPTGKQDLKAFEKQFGKLAKNPKTITDSEGTPHVVRTFADAEDILNSLGRQNFINKWGFAPEDDPVGKEVVIRTDDGDTVRGKITRTSTNPRIVPSGTGSQGYMNVNRDNSLGISFGNHSGVRDNNNQLVEQLNADLDAYNKKVRKLSKENGVDIQKLATSEVDRGKFKSNNNIPEEVPWEYVPAYLINRANIGKISPATVAESGPFMDKYREFLGANIKEQYYSNTRRNSKDRLKDLTDPYGFYKIDPETGNISRKAEDKIPLVKDDDLDFVRVVPEYLANNGKVVVGVGNTNYAISPELLGGSTAAQVTKLIEPVARMMEPIMHPEVAWKMTEEERRRWAAFTDSAVHQYERLVHPDGNGGIDWEQGYLDPRNLTIDERLRERIRRAITLYMDDIIAQGRDWSNKAHYIQLGNADSRWAPYNNGIEE